MLCRIALHILATKQTGSGKTTDIIVDQLLNREIVIHYKYVRMYILVLSYYMCTTHVDIYYEKVMHKYYGAHRS